MFLRMLIESLARRRKRKLLAVLAVWVGLSLVLGLLAVSLDVGDKMNRELRAFGANIRLTAAGAAVPVRVGGYELAASAQTAYLDERDLPKLKTIFWRNQILGINPRLWTKASIQDRQVDVLGVWLDRRIPLDGSEEFVTGARQVYPHWQVHGRWPGNGECLIGVELAKELNIHVGQTVEIAVPAASLSLKVVGLLNSGERDDRAVIASLSIAQSLSGLSGKVAEADISALTTPENKLAEKYHQDPRSLTPAEYERWVCTPYPGSVAADIQKAVPGSFARVVRRVAETQGAVLNRIDGLMFLLGMATLVSCALSILGVLASAVMERRTEAALLQAIGAHRGNVLLLFLLEAGFIGLLGGMLATGTGLLLGRWLVRVVFAANAAPHGALAVLALILGPLLALAASLWPTLRTVNQPAAEVLHGN